MTITFIGVDLAWQSDKNHSGIVVLQGDDQGAVFVHTTGVTTRKSVVEYIITHTTDNTVVAIDAPLVITNKTGQRPCENLIGRRFGRYHAAAHTSNLTRFENPGSIELVRELAQHGFAHNPDTTFDRQRGGRWCVEVYPHPAQVVLFNLEQIIKYKRGLSLNGGWGLRDSRCTSRHT